jgi:hypothetical protein
MDSIHNIPDENIFFTINDQLFLETLLFEIRGKSISYSSYVKKKKNKEEQDLMKEIKEMEESASEGNVDDESYDQKRELEKLRKYMIQGKYIRSRAQWIEEGEKPSNYFFRLESRNFTSKIIPKLELGNGDKLYNQSEILTETKNFYENLYKSILDTNVNLQNELANYVIYLHSQKESLKL